MRQLQAQDIQGKIYRPAKNSHKGENGKLLVIGGSTLFHASIFWSADMASRIVDLVHFTSPANENNELVRQKLKSGFWNGIVVPFERLDEYLLEDDCILIGPGMPRNDGLAEGEEPTGQIVNGLVAKYPDKRWVIDGGALQEMDPALLTDNMIITPHHKEWEKITQNSKLPPSPRLRWAGKTKNFDLQSQAEQVRRFSKAHSNVTVLLKGKEDVVCQGDEVVMVPGGNPGMTKGGTGDVMAGLVAALFCKNEAYLSAKIGSWVMKRAGEKLAAKAGVYFNAGDLVTVAPEILKGLSKK